jgi:hypothetical protein
MQNSSRYVLTPSMSGGEEGREQCQSAPLKKK